MNQAIFLKKPLPLLRTTPRIVPRLPLCRTVRAVSKEHAHLESEPIYKEPFLRAFLLGVTSGALLEIVHTAINFSAYNGGAHLSDFAPLLYADHATAILGWIAFYAVDVWAIKTVLKTYKDDQVAAKTALEHLVTLPKRLLPVRLAVFKQLLTLDKNKKEAAAGFFNTTADTIDTTASISALSSTTSSAFQPDSTNTTTSAAASVVVNAPPSVKKTQSPTTTAPKKETTNPPPSPQKKKKNIRPANLAPGQLDPADVRAFQRRRQELIDRRSYLHGFWYAAALSESLSPGQPLGVDILDQRVVLFRAATGEIRCLDDVCPHRGAPLSSGWIAQKENQSCVVCPYHGWAFDGEGHLKDVPAAESKGEWPKRQVVPVYDVEERGGFIWLWYGSADLPKEARPPIPCVPELEEGSTWKAVYGEIEFECNHSGVFENAIDMAHIHYLHSDSFGNQEKPEIRNMQCTADALSVTATFELCNKPASPLWEWTKVPSVHVTATAFLPSTSSISFTLGNGLSFTTFVNTVPVSANKSVNRFALVRNLSWDKSGAFNARAWDSWARRAMLKILGEDKVMVEQLRPERLVREFSVRADSPQVAFRKLRQEWVDLGYVNRSAATASSSSSSSASSSSAPSPSSSSSSASSADAVAFPRFGSISGSVDEEKGNMKPFRPDY